MRFLPLNVAAMLLLAVGTVRAQSADIVRGRVLDDSSRALVGASVVITRGPDRLVQSTVTDSAGRYSSRFEQGTGDYLVNVSSLGFRTARRRVQRLGNERELVVDFTMGRDLAMLAAVKVTAAKPVRASASISSPYQAETGASEQWVDGVAGRVSANQAGDLGAMAGTIPGVTLTAGGPTMLGTGVGSNLTTLNGMAIPGGSLPRAARTEMRVTGATFDPTRGGFAGANIDVRLGAGSRDFQNRNAYLTLNAPQLQLTDNVGRSLGLVNGGFRGSVGADGEAITRVLTYNIALDVGRTVSDPATLLGGDAEALRRAGLSPDSARRVLQVANAVGLPLSGGGIPTARQQDNITWLGRIDDIRDSLRTLTLTTYASSSKEGALAFGPLVAPAAGGKQQQRTMGAQFLQSQFMGAGYRTLMQNRLAISSVRDQTSPYVNLPGATVLARSSSDAASSDVVALSLGGNPFLAVDDSKWTLEGSNEMVWNAQGTKHRFKTQAWGRVDGLRQEGLPNALGQYTFNSLADFASNRASSYSRTLTQPARSATTYNGAVAVAHQWNPTRYFSMLYGARVEMNAFGDAPPTNSALEQALGVTSGVAPSRVHLSPRVGFSYTYSRAKDNGNGTNFTSVGKFYRQSLGFIRGGIGEFRDLYKPSMLADAVAGAGIAGSTLSLSCVGASIPVPDWEALANGSATLPSACADGSGALSERAPSVTLVDRAFDVPRSWRASLNWATNIRAVMVKIDALGSYDLSQPSTLDANFAGVARFALAGEGNRPMFVSTAAIDPNTGSVSAGESRISNTFGRVALRTSDLRGYGGQITGTIAPDVFRFRPRMEFYTSASYTLQQVRQQFRGFDGAGFGDPRETEWATGANDARHAVVVQGGIGLPKIGTITLFGRLQSGLPFTPIVRGDINGDGRANDRAFVPNPASEGDANTAAQMRALLSAAPANVRACLEAQQGTVAGRMSCRGSWTQQLNMQIQPRINWRPAGRRMSANIVLENPLAGLDQALHGANGLRGWGTRAMPDPVLLLPKSFNATTQHFRYDVNPRFGDTRAIRTLSRQPFRVTLDFSVDLSVPYDMQQLRRALEPVRVAKNSWQRRGTDSIAALYLGNTSNVHRLILGESDSLFLTKPQIDALLKADSLYSAKVRVIYKALGDFLATQPNGVAGKAALDSVQATTKLYWPIFWSQVDIMDTIVTPQQKALIPFLQRMAEVTAEDRKNSQWQFGNPVPLVHNRPRVAGEVNGPSQTQINRGGA
jgi:hypothetical protein